MFSFLKTNTFMVISFRPFFLPGYITTTKLKIILVVEDDVMSDLPIAQDEKDSQINSLLVCHPESCILVVRLRL
jgi:hypothetical protein